MSRRICALILLALPAFSQMAGLRFEANRGQADSRFRYLARLRGSPVGLTATGLELAGATLRFAGASPEGRWEAREALTTTSSYFLGADSSRWVRNAPHYSRIVRRSAYPGIDIQFRGDGEKLEFDFLVAPRAEPGRIRMAWSTGAGLRLLGNGDLEVSAARGPFVLHRPEAWQMIDGRKVDVPARFVLDEKRREAAIALAAYDRTRELLIDPVLDTWSFLGGSGSDRITVVQGNVTAGVTDSTGWLSGERRGRDIFVNFSGSYAVYGGSGDEEVTSAVILPDGAVVGGWTNSTDFPITGGTTPTQALYGGGKRDGFLLRYSSNWGQHQYLLRRQRRRCRAGAGPGARRQLLGCGYRIDRGRDHVAGPAGGERSATGARRGQGRLPGAARAG